MEEEEEREEEEVEEEEREEEEKEEKKKKPTSTTQAVVFFSVQPQERLWDKTAAQNGTTGDNSSWTGRTVTRDVV